MLALIAVPNSRKQVQRRRVQVGRQLASQGLLKRDQPRAVSATDAVDRVEDLAADLVGVQRRRVLSHSRIVVPPGPDCSRSSISSGAGSPPSATVSSCGAWHRVILPAPKSPWVNVPPLQVGDRRDHPLPHQLKLPQRRGVGNPAMRNLDTQFGELVQVLDRLLDPLSVLADVETQLHRLFDVGVVATFPFAVFAQHIELVAQFRGIEDVARVGVSATNRSVFFSPAPPIRIGGCGRVSGCGELSVRPSW